MAEAQHSTGLDHLLAGVDPGLSQSIRALWPMVRDHTAATCTAFLAEAFVFHLLRRAGIPNVRAFEGAPVDGALICPTGFAEDEEVPLEAYSRLEDWSKEHHDVRFIPFDVKHMSLGTAVSRTLDYQPSGRSVSVVKARGLQPAEFFIVVFEGVHDQVAIVPKESWLRARGTSRGSLFLINRVPAWYLQFMVATEPIEDFRKACQNMIESAVTGSTYQNPTTLLECHGFRPTGTSAPAIYSNPDSTTTASANKSYLALWQKLNEKGFRMRLNSVSPFFFDFNIDMPAPYGSLRFEHKYTTMSSEESKGFATMHCFSDKGRLSPFAAGRIWHVLWIDIPDGKVICFTRDQVKPSWENDSVPRTVIEEHTHNSFEEAMEHVRSRADAARQCADQALQGLRSDDIDLSLLFNTSDRPRKHLVDSASESEPSSDRALDLGLPWLCQQLNHQCRTTGFGIVLPMDFTHPLGNHVMVHYCWTTADQDSYDATGKLPRMIYSRDLCQQRVRCLVLRLQDHSLKLRDLKKNVGKISERMFPLMMRKQYWLKPLAVAEGEMPKFILVGSALDDHLLRQGEIRSSWYLLLPSEFTRMHDQGQTRAMPDMKFKDKGGHMFMAVNPAHIQLEVAPPVQGATSFNSRFLAEGIDPTRYLVNALDGTLIEQLRKILTAEGPVTVTNPQSKQSNRPFDATAYYTDLATVHQFSWDFGFTRKIRNKDIEDENTLPPLDSSFRVHKHAKTEFDSKQGGRE